DQIQAIDASYPDSQNVYAKSSQGLKGSAIPSKRVTYGLKIPDFNQEWAIVVIAYGWFLVSIIVTSLNVGIVAIPLTGLILGCVLWIGLRFSIPTLNKFHLAGLALGWAAGYSIVLLGGGALFLLPIAGFVGGLITATVIYRATHNLPIARFAIITFGWATSFFISRFVIEGSVIGPINLEVAIGKCAAGLLGSWVTLEAIKESPIYRPKWLLVISSMLGFIIGGMFSEIILMAAVSDENLSLSLLGIAIWGLLGGAALGISTRNFRRIAILAVAGTLGMLIGALFWMVVYESMINYNLDNFHAVSGLPTFLGLGIGLTLGISTKRIPSTLILIIAGVTAFGVVTWVYIWVYNNLGGGQVFLGDILGGALIGSFMGLVWGYLEKPMPE
ncbi:MAG: hypothetical protein ACWGOY_08000, partial [Anaerolineales bacterium]